MKKSKFKICNCEQEDGLPHFYVKRECVNLDDIPTEPYDIELASENQIAKMSAESIKELYKD